MYNNFKIGYSAVFCKIRYVISTRLRPTENPAYWTSDSDFSAFLQDQDECNKIPYSNDAFSKSFQGYMPVQVSGELTHRRM